MFKETAPSASGPLPGASGCSLSNPGWPGLGMDGQMGMDAQGRGNATQAAVHFPPLTTTARGGENPDRHHSQPFPIAARGTRVVQSIRSHF